MRNVANFYVKLRTSYTRAVQGDFSAIYFPYNKTRNVNQFVGINASIESDYVFNVKRIYVSKPSDLLFQSVPGGKKRPRLIKNVNTKIHRFIKINELENFANSVQSIRHSYASCRERAIDLRLYQDEETAEKTTARAREENSYFLMGHSAKTRDNVYVKKTVSDHIAKAEQGWNELRKIQSILTNSNFLN